MCENRRPGSQGVVPIQSNLTSLVERVPGLKRRDLRLRGGHTKPRGPGFRLSHVGVGVTGYQSGSRL